MKHLIILVACVYLFAHMLIFAVADSAMESWPIGYFSLLGLFFITDFLILKLFKN